MAKVGRAARVASRQRVETISADKTIVSAETGELYLVDHNAASTVTVTLPAAQDGAYFKFILITAMTDDSAVLKITSQSGDFLSGGPVAVTLNGSDPGSQVVGNGSSNLVLTLDGNTDVLQSSTIECYSDGSKWHITGLLLLAASATASNSIAFSDS
jgi:hypothetical protein